MANSSDRILTTHTGSLPRPEALKQLMFRRQEGEDIAPGEMDAAVDAAILEVVRRQRAAGIDIVSDGEMSKPGFVNYIGQRLSGFGGKGDPWMLTDMAELPDLVQALYGGPGGLHILMPRCEGEVRYEGQALVEKDIAVMKAALAGDDEAQGFFPSASPGCVANCAQNVHYPDYQTYLDAVAEAMAVEYKAIVDAGFILQLDCPDIPMAPHTDGWMTDLYNEIGFERFIDMQLRALDDAIGDLPVDRVRMHVCWGNYAGPHHLDVPVERVLEPALRAKPSMVSFEGANPRHEHEWETLAEMDIPDDKILSPGVIDTKTNVVEHPRLVAQRIERYANIVGRERVVPGTDCGFGTFVGFGLVEPDVAWMKLEALAQGAALASERLWSTVA
jgi:5-methyltetrahydropteroyltriglutamate--homocysteine methyltransferase